MAPQIWPLRALLVIEPDLDPTSTDRQLHLSKLQDNKDFHSLLDALLKGREGNPITPLSGHGPATSTPDLEQKSFDSKALILFTLMRIDLSLREMMLGNGLHTVLDQLEVDETDEDEAEVYGLILCNSYGHVPSEVEMVAALSLMENYSTSEDPEKWDGLAKKIDSTTAKDVDTERDWMKGQSERAIAEWKNVRGSNGVPSEKLLPHPRRYCHSQKARKAVREFIKQYRTRANNVSENIGRYRTRVEELQRSQQMKKGLIGRPVNVIKDWSLVSIGWTCSRNQRRRDHYNHQGLDQPIARLLETALFHLHPAKRYFLNFRILCRPFSASMVPIAAHCISDLCSSSVQLGGMNSEIPSTRKLANNALKKPNDFHYKAWLKFFDTYLNHLKREVEERESALGGIPKFCDTITNQLDEFDEELKGNPYRSSVLNVYDKFDDHIRKLRKTS